MRAVVGGPVVAGGLWCVLTVRLMDFLNHTVRLFGTQTVILLECLNVRESYCNNVILLIFSQ